MPLSLEQKRRLVDLLLATPPASLFNGRTVLLGEAGRLSLQRDEGSARLDLEGIVQQLGKLSADDALAELVENAIGHVPGTTVARELEGLLRSMKRSPARPSVTGQGAATPEDAGGRIAASTPAPPGAAPAPASLAEAEGTVASRGRAGKDERVTSARDRHTVGPDELLQQMRAEDGLYVLGCFERRVTLASQQVRALNLVYALHERRIVPTNGAILVVGGGVAGMTAAAGAARLGYKVTLVEQRDELLPLLRGNAKRWLHPRVYDWPEPDAEHPEADVPVLPWRAAPAGEVVEQLERQWKALPELPRIEVLLSARVVDLGQGAPRRVSLNAPGLKRREVAAVILAVGFGLERRVEGVDFVSYWDDDNLDQSPRRSPARYFISGTGDGGLIDAVRARLRGFRHDRLLADFVGAEELGSVRQALLDIEHEAVAREIRSAGSARDHLYDAYEGLGEKYADVLDASVDAAIRERLRNDVTVVLGGLESVPFSLGASMLSRFLVSRLLFAFGLAYHPGGFSRISRAPDGYEVQFQLGGPERFDRVICRHGPQAAIERAFPPIWEKCVQPMRAFASLDQTRWPIYKRAYERAP
ncbi:FAD-dependent oxidoreductase [Sorangium cellulosum]|nr:FAD-dependent oxidoreductase [Sorangium cellulosum]